MSAGGGSGSLTSWHDGGLIGTTALSSVGGMNRGGCSADFLKCLPFQRSSPCSVWMVYDLGWLQKSPTIGLSAHLSPFEGVMGVVYFGS